MSLAERFRRFLDELKDQGRYRRLALPAGIDFSSNDYLGRGRTLADSDFPSAPARPAPGDLARSGMASRLLRGQHPLWEEVESRLARWHGAEAALVMTSGYSANEGLLSSLLQPGDFLASDQYNHASIIDGARLAKADRFIFRHNDLNHLEDGLRQAAASRPAEGELFVITEALFGMEGDRAPLLELVRLAERYQAHLIVDEAHSTGCFGPAGGGLVDELALRDRILASVHTGGKALGVCGAYVCCSALLREVLINRCRHLIFTTALPPAVAWWWLEMLEQVPLDNAGRQALHAAARFFRGELTRHGVPSVGSDYIVPVLIGQNGPALAAAHCLQKGGFDIRAIREPTVPPGTARLRISIHADHTREELASAAAAVAQAIFR